LKPPAKLACRSAPEVRLLCGGDLLESFAVPNLWATVDVGKKKKKKKKKTRTFF
jgi:hypothetical protein